MKLFTRLLIAHAAPVFALTLALGVALVALLRISFILTTLSETELETLHDEGALHRAAWAMDVEMRHAQLACARGDDPGAVKQRLESTSENLRKALREMDVVSPDMQDMVQGYLGASADALSGPVCTNLLGAQLQDRRGQLDEQMTNLWVDRLGELHRAVSDKENDARRMAVSATWVGIPLAIGAFLLAMVIARRMALFIKRPLASLAAMAQRVGRGDFETSVTVDGPPEILDLAQDLERMRVQLQQLESLKQGFLASVSHELRTPLSKIREALALLQDGAVGALDEQQTRVVQIARMACEREIRMVTTLLDLSRLRAGSPLRCHDECLLDGVLESAVNDERNEAQQRGIVVELVVTGEPVTCRLDPVLMERAIANLVRNAVSVSSRGQSVRVARDVHVNAPERAGRWVCVTVTDEGPGVPEDVREKLFDAFVTSPVPQSGKKLGVGIGLALAREVARAHGGELQLGKSDASGSIFELWLPLDQQGSTPRSNAPRSLGLDYDMVAAS